MEPLSAKRRAELRALGNPLKPVILIGKEGVDERVVQSLDEYFQTHELAKVKILQSSAATRQEVMEMLCEKCEAHPVQQIGKTVLLYRPQPDEQKSGS